MTESFATNLLAWFAGNGRKHLPWQINPTPYRVWVSEVMLQQTQVVTVIPYFERFLARFPDIRTLAEAPVDEVLHLWTGLGYYARARNLQRAAQMIVQRHGGAFPRTHAEVEALPGIGRSTAGAILALACGQRQPILDGNVKRVLTRYFGIEGFPGERSVETRLWQSAEDCTPHEQVAAYTQAIMDLGATLCTRTRPNCPECPVHERCVARREGSQASLPTPRPKRDRPGRRAFVAVAMNAQGAVLLERRPPSGIWGGLWALPEFASEAECAQFLGQPPLRLAVYRHAFTHFDLDLCPLLVRNAMPQQVADSDRHCWYDAQQPLRIGLAKPVLDIIVQARAHRDHSPTTASSQQPVASHDLPSLCHEPFTASY